MDHINLSHHNGDFRSTFFTLKQSHGSHGHHSKDKNNDEADGDSVKVIKLLFRPKKPCQNIKISVQKTILKKQNKI